MAWLELSIQTKKDAAERISDFLEQINALSITFKAADDQAIFEPDLNTTPLWEALEVIALFPENTTMPDVIDALQAEFTEKEILQYRVKELADRCWERVWLDDWQPLRFGQRLCICPTAMEPLEPCSVIVRLDPGLAFGTGTHPSTALCLEWLEANVQNSYGQTLIDYGCGSGILAIAAVKCGAKKVFAIDHDQQAIAATQANALQNAISAEQLTCLFPQEFRPDVKVDIVVANILVKPLIALAPLFKQYIKKDGFCVLAGILSEQVESVQQNYRKQGFNCISIQHQDEWARMVFSPSNNFCT